MTKFIKILLNISMLLIFVVMQNEKSFAFNPNLICPPCLNCTTNFEICTNPPFAKEINGIYQECPIISGFSYGGVGYYFDIFFKIRKCYCDGDTINEIFINKIELYPPIDCSSLPKDMVINKAIQQLLYESWNIFNMGIYNTQFKVSINLPKCWACSYGPPPSYGKYELIATDCSPSTCCKTTYTMQMNDGSGTPPNRVIIISKTTIPPPDQTACSGSGGTGYYLQCNDICANNDIPTGPLFSGFERPLCSDDNCSYEWINTPETGIIKTFTLQQKNINQPSGWDYYCNVWFETRRNCIINGYVTNEIRISKIDILENDASKSDFEILKLAYRRLLRKAGDMFGWRPDNLNGGDTVNVVLRIPECWTRINNELLIPCNNISCCNEQYRIKRIGTPFVYRVNTSSGLSGTTGNCVSPCSTMCDAIDFLVEDLVYKISIGESEKDLKLEQNHSYVIPNPTRGTADIYLECELKGKLDLRISNSTGNLVQKQTKLKNSIKSVFEIEASNLANGVYYYQFILENNVIEKVVLLSASSFSGRGKSNPYLFILI